MSRYENYAIKNNVFGALSTPISSLATTIQLGDGQGQRFSVNMLATLENIENGKVMKREIVLITAINGDVLTVTRKYAPCPANDDANTQGQVSYAFSADDTISAYITKEHFDKIDNSINDIYDNGVNKLRTEVISGLQIKVNPGPILVGSGYYDFAGGNLTLIDNTTNYVEIDEDGLLVSNTTDRGDKHTKISKVTTSGGTITKIEDWRLGTVGGEIGGVNIHDLTEKNSLSGDDEFIIADSDNIYNNKKIAYKYLINNAPFGNGCDGDCVISENVFLCAKEYQFNNLTICSGAKLMFCGDGVPIIRVKGCFCNLGEIDLYGGPYITTSSRKIQSMSLGVIGDVYNTIPTIDVHYCGGQGGEGTSTSTGTWCGGNGGNGGNSGEAGCNGVGTSDCGIGGQPGNNSGGGGGGGGKTGGNCASDSVGTNGCDGGDGIGGDGGNGASRGSFSGGGGGGGFGLYQGGNGGTSYASNGSGVGGNGGDSCYCGGNGGNAYKLGGNGGFGYYCCGGMGGCGTGQTGCGGKGGDSYFGNGGDGGCGGYDCRFEFIGGDGGNSVYGNGGMGGGSGASGGKGGNGRNGGKGGSSTASGCCAGCRHPGYGGDARGGIYGLGLFVKNGVNCCINAKGGNGGDGGDGSGTLDGGSCGGNGANGGIVCIYAQTFVEGCVDVRGGTGGTGTTPGADGCDGVYCLVCSIYL